MTLPFLAISNLMAFSNIYHLIELLNPEPQSAIFKDLLPHGTGHSNETSRSTLLNPATVQLDEK